MSVRLFVGLPLPPEVVAALDAAITPAREHLDGLAWSRSDGWHVTLAFVGDVDEAVVDPVIDAVRRAASASGPIDVSLGPPGRFGRHALWVGLADAPRGAIVALGTAVQDALEDAELPVHRREVHAHVTVARARRGRRGRPVGDAEVAAVPVPPARWTADAVAVFRSERGTGPARYPVAASVPLSG